MASAELVTAPETECPDVQRRSLLKGNLKVARQHALEAPVDTFYNDARYL